MNFFECKIVNKCFFKKRRKKLQVTQVLYIVILHYLLNYYQAKSHHITHWATIHCIVLFTFYNLYIYIIYTTSIYIYAKHFQCAFNYLFVCFVCLFCFFVCFVLCFVFRFILSYYINCLTQQHNSLSYHSLFCKFIWLII